MKQQYRELRHTIHDAIVHIDAENIVGTIDLLKESLDKAMDINEMESEVASDGIIAACSCTEIGQ